MTAEDTVSLRRRRDAVRDADLVELRLDFVRDVDVAGALRDRSKPVVVTCRPIWEGGTFGGSEEERRRILEQAVSLGAEYVDIERRASWRPALAEGRTQLVLSDHDFNGVPADLASRVAAMRNERPAVVKVAAMAQSASDCLALRDGAGSEPSTVVIGMGGYGRLTRVLPSRFGSCWTYAGTAAPGQSAASELFHQFRVTAVSAATQVFAVTGDPLGHSASPAMHNAAFQALGLDAVYVPLQAVSIDDANAVAEALDIRGMSVTAPLKCGWPVRLDDEAARALQTINTLKRWDGVWLGRNVDGDGFLDAFDSRGLDLTSQRVVVLGAGGAARAVARAALSRGAHVTVCARRAELADRLATSLGAAVAQWPLTGRWDVIVNATSAGTWPSTESPLPTGALATVVYDLVYNPEATPMLEMARVAGAQVIGGLEMLVGQAVRQSAWWTGHEPSRAVMTTAARAWIASAVHVQQGEQ